MCVCVCVCVCVMNVYTTLAYSRISSFCAIHKHTHTRILKPFEDSEPTGLTVDTAGTTNNKHLSMCICAPKPENNKCKRVRELEHTDICEHCESAREWRMALYKSSHHHHHHHHLRHENLNKAKAHQDKLLLVKKDQK